MLKISAQQMQAVLRNHFMEKTRSFLLERSPHKKMLSLLAQQEECFSFWSRLLDELGERDEYTLAVILSFALASVTQGHEPEDAVRRVLAKDDAEYTMKQLLAHWGILRFSEFDL